MSRLARARDDTSPAAATTGPGAPCAWCRRPIPAGKRRDARTCRKACRQSHWRFARHRPRSASTRDASSRDGSARLAYADPPYPGKAFLYRDHPDYAGEVDHRALLEQLQGYDGWALSTSSEGLRLVIPLCEALGLNYRVASWHRGPRKVRSLSPWQAWEPIVYQSARPVARAGVADAFAYAARPRLSDPDRVIGAKPAPFIFWVFELLGARPGDDLDDLFPGSGGVARAWALFQEGIWEGDDG